MAMSGDDAGHACAVAIVVSLCAPITGSDALALECLPGQIRVLDVNARMDDGDRYTLVPTLPPWTWLSSRAFVSPPAIRYAISRRL